MSARGSVSGESSTSSVWIPNRRTLVVGPALVGIALIVITAVEVVGRDNPPDPASGTALGRLLAQYPAPFVGLGLFLIAGALMTALRRGTRVDDRGIHLPYEFRPLVPWSRISRIRATDIPLLPRRYVITTNSPVNPRVGSNLFKDPLQFEQAIKHFASAHVELFPSIGERSES